MSKHNVVELSRRGVSRDELTEPIRDGARKLVGEALESEPSELLSSFLDGDMRRVVQRWSGIAISRSERFRPVPVR